MCDAWRSCHGQNVEPGLPVPQVVVSPGSGQHHLGCLRMYAISTAVTALFATPGAPGGVPIYLAPGVAPPGPPPGGPLPPGAPPGSYGPPPPAGFPGYAPQPYGQPPGAPPPYGKVFVNGYIGCECLIDVF